MTTNPRKYYKNNCITKKVAPSYNQKVTNSRRIKANITIFSNANKEMHEREIIIPAHPAAAQRPFPFFMTLIISI
jgi:hypothetical protein